MKTAILRLESQWQDGNPGPKKRGSIALLVTRASSAAMPKDRDKLSEPMHQQPARIHFSVEEGVRGDRWKPGKTVTSQISITSVAVCQLVEPDPSKWHLFGNNLVVDLDLSLANLPVGTRLQVGTGEVEISAEEHTPCDRYQARFGEAAFTWASNPEVEERCLRGRLATVLRSGTVAIGDVITVISTS